MRVTSSLPGTLSFVLISLALRSAPAPAQDLVGINAHLAPNDMYDAAADLGVGFVRIDNNWLAHEPADGRYDWGELDRAVNRIVGHGQRVFMTIAYTPAWAAEAGQNGTQGSVPRAGLYERYVQAVVTRYRDRVQHYGMWNEPNLGGFWAGSAAEYADRIVTPGAAAVHAACAGCLVVGPDLAGVGDWQQFLEQVFQRVGATFDIVSHHTYAKPRPLHRGWICDDFAHAIDSSADPICFYKPGLRQILDEFDATRDKEVWISETGYQAEPWDAANEQIRQADFVDGVLDLQLAVPWWTQTYFYELVDCRPIQPDCDIDGFGLARRTAGPDDTWADNFLLKPAYLRLRDRIADDVHLQGEGQAPPPPPPPARELAAQPVREGAPEASLERYAPESCIVVPDYVALAAPRVDAEDLWVMACAGWSADALWLGFEAHDETHENAHPDDLLWQGDSVQIAVDVRDDAGGAAGYGPDDAEITVGLVNGATRVNVGPGNLPAVAQSERREERTFTEVRIGWPGRAVGQRLHVSFLINDADGQGRDGWLEWTPGIGREKNPAAFGYLVLVPDANGPAPDAGRVDAFVPGPADAAVRTDALPIDSDGTRADARATDGLAPGRLDGGATDDTGAALADFGGGGGSVGAADVLSGAVDDVSPGSDRSVSAGCGVLAPGRSAAAAWALVLGVALVRSRRVARGRRPGR